MMKVLALLTALIEAIGAWLRSRERDANRTEGRDAYIVEAEKEEARASEIRRRLRAARGVVSDDDRPGA